MHPDLERLIELQKIDSDRNDDEPASQAAGGT